MNSQARCPLLRRLWMYFCFLACFLAFHTQAKAQEKPPRPIEVRIDAAQQLNFGKFIPIGSGGTITVEHTTGSRSSFQGIIPVGFISSPARFIVDAEPGTVIRIVDIPDATLNGSNGGYLNLHFGEWSIPSPFITTSQYTYISIGGTLTVGSLMANPAGLYNGMFQVTFIQE